MLILGIDTSTNVGSVALYSTIKGVLGEISINVNNTHSENIMVAIDSLMNLTKTKISDVEKIAVSIGPGSFTGIRIGVGVAKGLGTSIGSEIVGINELDIIANNATYTDMEVCSIIDARKERGYYSTYKFNGKKLEQIQDYNVGELKDLLETRKDIKTLYLGDGAIKYKEMIKEIVGENSVFANLSLNLPRASVLCELGQDKTDNIYTLEPIYLSKPQAEREKEAREEKR